MNCVTDTTRKSILRLGFSPLNTDGSFDSGTETYDAAVTGALTEGVQLSYHKIVAGVITEMTAGEKTDVDDDDALTAVGAVVYRSRQTMESIGADVDISFRPCVSQITAYTDPISLSDGTKIGQEKKIYNDGTGVAVLVNCTLPGSDTQVRINNNQNVTLMWNGSLWRHIDGIVGITLQ